LREIKKMFQKKIHVFKAGDQTSAQGVNRSFSEKDLQQVVESYDPSVHEAPLVLGHQGDSDSLPSFGWIKGFERKGQDLYANVAFTDVAKDLVKDGHYRKVSISFYSPDSQINPTPGQWTARHLALLGAAPPAVKGLEPFNFAEWDSQIGVYDFAIALTPNQVFDEDLGPTMIRELSPMEMLREKLDAARSEMTAEVNKITENNSPQAEIEDTSAEVAEQEDNASEVENPSNPSNYSERPRKGDNARSLAQLEDQFPKDNFMEMQEGISRKKKSTPHGQVSQVVENVYREDDEDEMSTDHEEMGADNPKMRNPRMQPNKVDYNEVSDKMNPKPGKVKFGKHPENPEERTGNFGRYQTGKSEEQSMDRAATGKTSYEETTFGRDEIARGRDQHDAGRPAIKNSQQDSDRVKTGRYIDPDDNGRYDEMSREEIMNSDQYDDDTDYGVNNAKVSKGRDPYGRIDSESPIPSDTEEMPDDTIFASKVENVTRAKNARVMQIKSSDPALAGKYDGKAASNYAEPEPAEITGKDGVYGEMKGKKKKILSGDFEGGPNQETLKTGGVYSEGDYKSYKGEPKSTKKALTPGAFDSDDDEEPAEKTGPSGVTGGADHGEMEYGDMSKLPPALRKRAEEVKDKGHFAEDHKESTRERKEAADRGFEAKRQRKEGKKGEAHETKELMKEEDEDFREMPDFIKKKMEEKKMGKMSDDHSEVDEQAGVKKSKKGILSGEYEGGVGEETGPSGVTSGDEFKEHEKNQNPYTETGFGSTYKEDEEEMEDDEYSDCGDKKPMGRNYKEKGKHENEEFAEFFAELKALKAENARIKHEYREAKIARRRDQIHSFVENLYEAGKMVDSIIPESQLIQFAEGLEFGTLEFAEGESATTVLFSILNNLPNLVDFSEYAGGSMKFVDESDMNPHEKALSMVEKSNGEMSYVDALKKAMYS